MNRRRNVLGHVLRELCVRGRRIPVHDNNDLPGEKHITELVQALMEELAPAGLHRNTCILQQREYFVDMLYMLF